MGIALRIVGILLIVFGVFALTNHKIDYTKQEKLADIGPVHVTRENTETIPLSPIAGGISIVLGVVLIVIGGHQRPK